MKEVRITSIVTFSDALLDDEVLATRITRAIYDALAEEATGGILLPGEIRRLTGQSGVELKSFQVACTNTDVRLTWEEDQQPVESKALPERSNER
jgi:hypothetical protein